MASQWKNKDVSLALRSLQASLDINEKNNLHTINFSLWMLQPIVFPIKV
jgi:hypothetical protein